MLKDVRERVKLINQQITLEKKKISEQIDAIQVKLNECDEQLKNQADHLVKMHFQCLH